MILFVSIPQRKSHKKYNSHLFIYVVKLKQNEKKKSPLQGIHSCKGRINAVPPLFISQSEQHVHVSQRFCNVNLTSSLTEPFPCYARNRRFSEAVQKLPSTYLFFGISFSRRTSFSVKSICVLLFLTTFFFHL